MFAKDLLHMLVDLCYIHTHIYTVPENENNGALQIVYLIGLLVILERTTFNLKHDYSWSAPLLKMDNFNLATLKTPLVPVHTALDQFLQHSLSLSSSE